MLKLGIAGFGAAWQPWLLALVLALAGAAAMAAPDHRPEPAATAEATAANSVFLNHRRIVTFRGAYAGDNASERAELARIALQEAAERRTLSRPVRVTVGEALRFDLDGRTLFYLVPEDIGGGREPGVLAAAAQKIEARLVLALHESHEATDPKQTAISVGLALAATVVLVLLVRGLWWLRRRALALMRLRIGTLRREHAGTEVFADYAEHAETGAQWAARALSWLLLLLLLDLWATFVLRQFAYTRPWGERSTAWLLDTLSEFALGAAAAVPGLLTAALVFLLARLATRANSVFMKRVERGELQFGWLDIDTAGPTRRLGNLVIWLFALAMAYPYLPGAGTEAFKGVTVLAGLMICRAPRAW